MLQNRQQFCVHLISTKILGTVLTDTTSLEGAIVNDQLIDKQISVKDIVWKFITETKPSTSCKVVKQLNETKAVNKSMPFRDKKIENNRTSQLSASWT